MRTSWSLWRSNRAHLSRSIAVISRYFLNGNLVLKFLENILSRNFICLFLGVLGNEVRNGHIASTNTAEDSISLFNLDVDSLLTKLIYTFGLSQEHNVHFFALGIPIDEVGQLEVYLIILVSDIDALTFL